MTSGDICRHLGLKRRDFAIRDSPFAIRDSQLNSEPQTRTANSERQSYTFLVAVMADGDVSLMVLPPTVPTYCVVPAVKVISAPFRRPWMA